MGPGPKNKEGSRLAQVSQAEGHTSPRNGFEATKGAGVRPSGRCVQVDDPRRAVRLGAWFIERDVAVEADSQHAEIKSTMRPDALAEGGDLRCGFGSGGIRTPDGPDRGH